MPRLPSFEQWRQEPFLTGRLSWGLSWLDLFGLGIDSPFHYHSLHGVYNRVLATAHLMTRRPKSCQCLNADEKKNSQLTENAGATECNLAIFCCDWLVSWIHQPAQIYLSNRMCCHPFGLDSVAVLAFAVKDDSTCRWIPGMIQDFRLRSWREDMGWDFQASISWQ